MMCACDIRQRTHVVGEPGRKFTTTMITMGGCTNMAQENVSLGMSQVMVLHRDQCEW